MQSEEAVEEPKPQWQMRLYGIPCEHCWKPAEGLVVFERDRYVVHIDRTIKACRDINPPPSPAVPLAPRRRVAAAKKKQPTKQTTGG